MKLYFEKVLTFCMIITNSSFEKIIDFNIENRNSLYINNLKQNRNRYQKSKIKRILEIEIVFFFFNFFSPIIPSIRDWLHDQKN